MTVGGCLSYVSVYLCSSFLFCNCLVTGQSTFSSVCASNEPSEIFSECDSENNLDRRVAGRPPFLVVPSTFVELDADKSART